MKGANSVDRVDTCYILLLSNNLSIDHDFYFQTLALLDDSICTHLSIMCLAETLHAYICFSMSLCSLIVQTISNMLFYDLSSYFYVAHAFLEECSSGLEDSSVASADRIIDSAGSKCQHINLLVTSGSLIPSLVKCMLFRFDNLITDGNGQSANF